MNLRYPVLNASLVSLVMEAGALILRSLRVRVLGHHARYRPEAHYIRGPGPKWREKQNQRCRTAA